MRTFSDAGLSDRKSQVSYSGGTSPKWRRDGRELFFLGVNKTIIAVTVSLGATFHSDSPQTLFAPGIDSPDATFDVTADGQRFILPSAVSVGNAEPPGVVLNWIDGVSRPGQEDSKTPGHLGFPIRVHSDRDEANEYRIGGLIRITLF